MAARETRAATEDDPEDDGTTAQAPCRSSCIHQQVISYKPSMTGKRYKYAASQMAAETYKFNPRVVETVMTQLSMKAAIKMGGNEAKIAAETEMKQLHWQNLFRPVHWNDLSKKKSEMILESHIFMQQKRTSEIKGRAVAGGNKQRDYESIITGGSREMKVHQGKVHKYLGMTLDFSTKCQIKILMVDFANDVVAASDKVAPQVNEDSLKPVQKRCRKWPDRVQHPRTCSKWKRSQL